LLEGKINKEYNIFAIILADIFIKRMESPLAVKMLHEMNKTPLRNLKILITDKSWK